MRLSETLQMYSVLRIGNGPANSNRRDCYYEVKFKWLPVCFLGVGVYKVNPEILLFEFQH